ncbi:O-antigen ligase family protein [Rossellomorea vietnamensis]|uniref:O-antigen ligase family protein n=1 Tax=Rossellomorea vietnamensis TaxID=218284 RepID=UPI00077C6ED6|nr:O-antigen ligase family protein [Rossellomorea vietnamensis]
MKELKERYLYILAAAVLYIAALVIPNSKIGLGVSLVLAVLAFIKPKDGLLSLLIYFPMRSFLTEINPGLKLAGDIIIIAVFLRVLWNHKKNIKSLFHFTHFEWGFFAFMLIGTVAAFLTGVQVAAIVFQIRAFFITYLVYYSVKRLGITKEDVARFLWVTFTVAMILTVQGLVEKLSIRSMFMPETWVNRQLSPNNATRIYGLINNPNVLAVYLSIALMTSLYLYQNVSKRGTKIFLMISMVLMTGVWTLTYSRGTWIGFAIGLVIYILLTRNWKSMSRIALILIASVILINIPVAKASNWIKNTDFGQIERNGPPEEDPNSGGGSTEGKRLKDTFEKSTLELSKQTGRLFIVFKGFEIFKDHPVIGTGFATYGDSATKSYSSPIYSDYGIDYDIYSDNQYIQVIVQTGALGVIAFAVFLLGMLFTLWKMRKSSLFAIPLIGLLIGIYWCGFIYNIWEDKTFTLYFFMMLGFILNEKEYKERNRNESITSH